jgi:GNAT superfamily N-acetyltransferase
MAKAWLEIIDDERLEERVATEKENADLFGDAPKGSRVQRMDYVTRPTIGLWEIRFGLPKDKRNIAISVGRRIVAVAGVQVNPRDTRMLWVTHISVEEKHRGKRFGRWLMKRVYQYAVEQGKIVEHSSLTPMGKERLQHLHAEFDAKYPQATLAGHSAC